MHVKIIFILILNNVMVFEYYIVSIRKKIDIYHRKIFKNYLLRI